MVQGIFQQAVPVLSALVLEDPSLGRSYSCPETANALSTRREDQIGLIG